MTPLFELAEGLTMREVTEEDRAQVAEWIAADPAHRESCNADFFVKQEIGKECYVVEDDAGTLFYLRLTKTCRMDVQFGPDTMRARTRHGLVDGFPKLRAMLAARNFHECHTESKNPVLARSLEKRLGFVRSTTELLRKIRKGD